MRDGFIQIRNEFEWQCAMPADVFNVFHQSCHICQPHQTNVSMAISLVAINLPHLCVQMHASKKICFFAVDFIDFPCDFDAVPNEYIGR